MKETFIVQGMHCASCSLTVERALKSVPGVINASVSFASEKATVEYDDSVSRESLVQAVTKTGYKLASLIGADPGSAAEAGEYDHHRMLKEAEIAVLKKKFSISASPFFSLFPPPPPPGGGGPLMSHWFRLALLIGLTAPVEFWACLQFWKGAWQGLKNLTAKMDTLVVMGTG